MFPPYLYLLYIKEKSLAIKINKMGLFILRMNIVYSKLALTIPLLAWAVFNRGIST